jgi:hypothetical protein
MARYFTVSQAERALPEVERLLRDAIFYRAEYDKTDAELRRTDRQIRQAGGTLVSIVGIQAARDRRDSYLQQLKLALEGIEEAGAQIKDLDIGLIDFLTLYQNREVCLCWKLGEQAILFWHGAGEGFRGRKPIDEEFLAGHRGEMAN